MTLMKLPSLKLTSIRPVVLDFTSIKSHSIGDQLYNHFKNTPKEYHAIFSRPSKWFSTGIITENTLRRIISDFPGIIDTTRDYFLDFAMKKNMWDILPTKTFPLSNWRFIYSSKFSGDKINRERIAFTKRWIENFDESTKSLLIDEFKIYWDSNKSGVNITTNKYILSIMEAFDISTYEYNRYFPLMDPYPLDFQSMLDEIASTPPLTPTDEDEELKNTFPNDDDRVNIQIQTVVFEKISEGSVKKSIITTDEYRTLSLLDLFAIDIVNQSVPSDSDLSGYKSESKFDYGLTSEN